MSTHGLDQCSPDDCKTKRDSQCKPVVGARSSQGWLLRDRRLKYTRHDDLSLRNSGACDSMICLLWGLLRAIYKHTTFLETSLPTPLSSVRLISVRSLTYKTCSCEVKRLCFEPLDDRTFEDLRRASSISSLVFRRLVWPVLLCNVQGRGDHPKPC